MDALLAPLGLLAVFASRTMQFSFQQFDGYPLSVALGYATAATGDTLADAQRAADARMYTEKSTCVTAGCA